MSAWPPLRELQRGQAGNAQHRPNIRMQPH